MVEWRNLFINICFLAIMTLAVGCAGRSHPADRYAHINNRGEQIVAISERLVGSPYRYGGETPKGFDCSGLVRYVYRQIGITVPHSSRRLFQQARKVSLDKLRPGDLLFFSISRNKISHVGIYADNGAFIHAPSSGKRVSVADMNNPYWEKRLIGAGRIY